MLSFPFFLVVLNCYVYVLRQTNSGVNYSHGGKQPWEKSEPIIEGTGGNLYSIKKYATSFKVAVF